MGGGKTLLSLSLLRYRKACGDNVKAIVFVPYITSIETWVDEVAKHAPDLRCVALSGSGNVNVHGLRNGNGDLFVACYQSVVSMVSRQETGKWKLDRDLVASLFAGFNFFVMDEIHKCKSASSLTYKLCRVVAKQADWVIGLTGTPFGRDLLDLWPQFNLIDFGETLGPTLGFYREAFFTKKVNYWGGYEYSFQKSKFPHLKRLIKNRSIHYGVDEFNDMPPKQYIIRNLKLPMAAEGYAAEAVKQIKEAIKAGDRYRVVENHFLQLQQLASGFMTLRGEDNEKLQVEFDENPKLEELDAILGGISSTDRVVIFHHFVYTSQLISKRLQSTKIEHVCINGSVRDPIAALRRFRQTTCRALVINCKSGSSSLNLQNANYIVFFEQPLSAIDRQQAEARCWRPGQQKRVFIYDLLMKGTADHRLYQANKAGSDLLKELLSGRSQL